MPESPAPTPERILDAAIEAASIHGLTKLSVADVAKRARLSRPTLYKHFPTKEDLIAAAVAREATNLVSEVVAAAEPICDPREAIEVAFSTALRLARDHPLLDRIVRSEPETLVPLLTADGGPVLVLARQAVEGTVAAKLPAIDAVLIRRFSDLFVRLVISYAVNAPDDPPEVVAAVAARVLTEGALSYVPEVETS